jgi:DNA segregation ATPase FtsK/SpoIIIE-like protein
MRTPVRPRRTQTAQPTTPSAAYRVNQECTLWRDTLNRRATSVTEAPSSTSHTALYRCSATRSSISITGSFRSPQTTEELHDHARNSTPTGPRQRKCQAPTGTTVAKEPELRPKLSNSYRNPMVKHEPELHSSGVVRRHLGDTRR